MTAYRFVGDLAARGPTRTAVSRVRQLVTVPALIVWCLLAPPTYVLSRLISPRAAEAVVRLFHRGVLRCFNLEVVTEGDATANPPTLFVANHSSYMDVFVLGSLVPGYFVAKADVARWPVLGKLAAIQQTVFVERDPRRAAEQIGVLRQRLAEPANLFVFPEGTSSDGVRVLPFRPSLFEVACDPEVPVAVRPVTIAYRDYAGEPMAPADRDRYAWYLPMTFLPHFLNGLGLRRARVVVRFHDPLPLADHDRKALARAAEAAVAAGMADLLPNDFESSQAQHPSRAA